MKIMKLLVTLLFLFFITGIMGCKESTSNVEDNLLIGKWQLNKVEGGFSPVRHYNGEIIWEIINSNQIKVTTSVNNDYPLLKPNSLGFYSYRLVNDTIVLQNSDNRLFEKFSYIIDSSSFVLNGNLSADGLRISFERK